MLWQYIDLGEIFRVELGTAQDQTPQRRGKVLHQSK